MKGIKNIIFMQFFRMFSSVEIKISFTAVFICIAVSFFELCSKVSGLDSSELYTASYGWIGNAPFLGVYFIQFFFLLFIFFIGAVANSDNYYIDKKSGMHCALLTRCKKKHYILSGAITTFCGGFLVILIPFLISQLLSFILFPLNSSVQTAFSGTASYQTPMAVGTLFPFMFYNYPYIYNLITITYISTVTGIFAMLSYGISFFINHRLLIIGIPTILIVIQDILFPQYSYSKYFMMGLFYNATWEEYLGLPLVILVISLALIQIKLTRMRDEL